MNPCDVYAKWDQHDQRTAERDGMLRGAKDAEVTAPRDPLTPGSVKVQERQNGVKVVEDVVAGVALDERESGYYCASTDEDTDDSVEVAETTKQADDDVEHQIEAAEEEQLLRYICL